MKKNFGILTILLCMFIVSENIQAQQTLNPNGQILYYRANLIGTDTARAYANTTTDTLPNLIYGHWAQAPTQSYALGGASFVTLRISCKDSLYAVIYVDELIGATWTAIVTDSIVSAVNTGVAAKEFTVRSQATETTAKLGGRFRVRLVFPNYRTQGVSNAYYKADFLWKP